MTQHEPKFDLGSIFCVRLMFDGFEEEVRECILGSVRFNVRAEFVIDLTASWLAALQAALPPNPLKVQIR